MKPKSQCRVIEILHRWAGKTIFFVDDFYQIEEITDGGGDRPFVTYKHYDISPLGPSHRGQLISKRVQVSEDEEFAESDGSDPYREIADKEKLISTLLGKQLLPAYPIFILGILQALEAGRNVNTATGSYGELFESLITDRLARVSGKPSEIGTKYTYVARPSLLSFSQRSAVPNDR